MVSKVEVHTEKGSILELPLFDPSNGYVVADIEGLDPVKATVVTSNFANLEGEQYQSSRREKRNIVLKLDIKQQYTNKTVRELRSNLYKFLMPKANVKLRFFLSDLGYVDIAAKVESFEFPLFEKDPKATISLLCFNPDFVVPTPKIVSGNTTVDLVETPIEYAGSIETGILFRLSVNRIFPDGFTIYNNPEDGTTHSLQFFGSFIAGDVVEISTVSGAKRATLYRGTGSASVLYGVAPYSSWIELFPGQNNVRVFANGSSVPYTIEYTDKHGGL